MSFETLFYYYFLVKKNITVIYLFIFIYKICYLSRLDEILGVLYFIDELVHLCFH